MSECVLLYNQEQKEIEAKERKRQEAMQPKHQPTPIPEEGGEERRVSPLDTHTHTHYLSLSFSFRNHQMMPHHSVIYYYHSLFPLVPPLVYVCVTIYPTLSYYEHYAVFSLATCNIPQR